jgi:hypothetical protein
MTTEDRRAALRLHLDRRPPRQLAHWRDWFWPEGYIGVRSARTGPDVLWNATGTAKVGSGRVEATGVGAGGALIEPGHRCGCEQCAAKVVPPEGDS